MEVQRDGRTCLELGLEAGEDGGGDEAADAAAVDAQHGDEPPLRRRRARHRRLSLAAQA